MLVRIAYLGSKLLDASVNEQCTVIQLKDYVAHKINVPSSDQVLTFNGVYLVDSQIIKNYRIPEGGSLDLYLNLNYSNIIIVRVVISATNVLNIPLRANATVKQLRAEIVRNSEDPSIQSCFLIFQHLVLENDRSLAEYGIETNSCVTVAGVLEPNRPGPSSPPFHQAEMADQYDYCDDFRAGRPELPQQATPHETYRDVRPKPIQVHFLADDCDPFTLSVPPNVPLETFCQNVLEKTGIPIENQVYINSGAPMDPHGLVMDLGIKEGDSVFLQDSRVIYPSYSAKPKAAPSPRSKDIISINFATHKQSLPMRIPREATINVAIQTLQKHSQIMGKRLTLYTGNKALDPTRTFADYGIKDHETIFVHVHSDSKPYQASRDYL